MPLYLLRASKVQPWWYKNQYSNDPEDYIANGYDCAFGFVVRASDPGAARFLVSESKRWGDEGPAVWLDSNKTSCEEIAQEGEPEILIRDFLAG